MLAALRRLTRVGGLSRSPTPECAPAPLGYLKADPRMRALPQPDLQRSSPLWAPDWFPATGTGDRRIAEPENLIPPGYTPLA